MKIRRTQLDAEAANADLLAQLHSKGIPLSEDDTQILIDKGVIKAAKVVVKEDSGDDGSTKDVKLSLSIQSIFKGNRIIHPEEASADRRICIVQPRRGGYDRMLRPGRVLTKSLHERELNDCAIFFGAHKNISKADWLPESVDEHTQEFIDWINSISSELGFWERKNYTKFNLYVQQAEAWLRDYQTEDMSDLEYQVRELHRIDENKLFALNKYLEIEESNDKGTKKYVATPAHQILLYLLDCNYSGDLAKARQLAITTTIAGWCMMKTMTSINYKIKYISENVDKAENTISEKLKYPFSRMPAWSRPDVLNDWMGGIYFAKRISKGVLEGNNSIVEVLPPTATAVASTTPDATFVDEIGQIEHIQSIEGDVEPTLYGYNPVTKKQERLRIFWQWGTGGEMNGKAGVAFQSSYLNHIDKWKSSNRCTIIPLMFNVWWRPGWSKERQAELKNDAYSYRGPDAEKRRVKFHQSYPETLDDIFKQSGNSIVSDEYIEQCMEKIKSFGEQGQCTYGRFEPIYDTTVPAQEGSDVPFKITGAQFIPMKKGDHGVTAIIFDNRRPWKNRYYQGTDPISSKSGQSDMASVIWDAHWMCPVALIMCRHQGDPRKDFLQTLLLGLYYDVTGEGPVPELVEANIGGAYVEYKTNKGFEKSLILESQLPDSLISARNSVGVGIDNKQLRNDLIITQMRNILHTYGFKIFIPVIWVQARTFVEKIKGVQTIWEPIDKRINRDDVLFGLTYSYICYLCYAHKTPYEIEDKTSTKPVMQWKVTRQKDGSLKGKFVRKTVQNLRPDVGA